MYAKNNLKLPDYDKKVSNKQEKIIIFFAFLLFYGIFVIISEKISENAGAIVFNGTWASLILIILIMNRISKRDYEISSIWDSYLEGNVEDSISRLNKIIKKYIFRRKMYVLMIKIYYQIGYIEDLKIIIKKVKIRKNENALIFVKGYLNQIDRNYEEAIRCYQIVYEKEKFEQLSFNLSSIYFELEDYNKSLEYLFECLEMNKSNNWTFFNIGKVYEVVDDNVNANKFYNHFLESIEADGCNESNIEFFKYAKEYVEK